MIENNGICPKCERRGAPGEACAAEVCRKRGYHYIPAPYFESVTRRCPHGIDPSIGKCIDDYLLVDEIGQGGYGKVYLSLQLPVFMKTAFKLSSRGGADKLISATILDKFRDEAMSLAQLSHPNIVKLLKFGVTSGLPYLVMEYVDNGRTLTMELASRVLDARNLPLATVTRVFIQILNALAAAHERQIIHRDIKPDNVMLQTVTGDEHFVRILDFGLAKFVAKSSETTMITGTPVYMAPEQVNRENIGPWTDLYAVGVMLFELLVGVRPFNGKTAEQILYAKMNPRVDPLAHLDGKDLPADAYAFFSEALAREPARRFQDVGAFRKGMMQVLEAFERHGRDVVSFETLMAVLEPDELAEVEAIRAHAAGQVADSTLQEAPLLGARTSRSFVGPSDTFTTPPPSMDSMMDGGDTIQSPPGDTSTLVDGAPPRLTGDIDGAPSSSASDTIASAPPGGMAAPKAEGRRSKLVPVLAATGGLLLAVIAVLAWILLGSGAEVAGVHRFPSVQAYYTTVGGDDDDTITALSPGDDGTFVFAGTTSSKGLGGADFWYGALDDHGAIAWDGTFGGVEDDGAAAVALLPGGDLVVAGDTTSKGAGKEDCQILRVSPGGKIQWDVVLGGEEVDNCHDVIPTADGGVIAVGATMSKGAGDFDGWITRLDATGQVTWERTLGGELMDETFAGIPFQDGAFALAGWTHSQGQGKGDLWLVVVDGAGEVLWERTMGGDKSDGAYALSLRPGGGLVLAGWTASSGAGARDVYVVAFDASGTPLWTQTYGGVKWDVARDVAALPGGRFAVGGYTMSKGAGGRSGWVLVLDDKGYLVWDEVLGSTHNDEILSTVGVGQDLLVAGYTTPGQGSKQSDGLLVRFGSNGLVKIHVGAPAP